MSEGLSDSLPQAEKPVDPEQAAPVEKSPEAPDNAKPIKTKAMLSIMLLEDGRVFLNSQGVEDKLQIVRMLASATIAAVDHKIVAKSPIIHPHGKTPGAFGNPAA